LSTADYLQLSVDGLFVPLTVIAALALIGLRLRPLMAKARRIRRALPIIGLLLVLNGLSAIVVATPLNRALVVSPTCLAVGTALLVLSSRATKGPAPVGVAVTEWAVIVVLVGLSLFWAANDYSAAVGRSRAREMAAQLPAFPDATIYSDKALSMRNPGVRETRCATKEIRYDGLKLILHSGDEYLFLPATWSQRRGVALLMPKSDAARLEFTAPASKKPLSC
jgi:hypothetical protein